MINDFTNLDLNKYDRIFAIGCSFTAYRWPTWADILIRGNGLDSKFINLGKSGAGNQYISQHLSLANLKYKFTDRDLVMVMFTGITREDRYVNNQWQTPGNIYTQNYYNEAFIEKYADIKGYMIRDGALIDMSYAYMKSQSCDTIMLLSVPLDYQGNYVLVQEEVGQLVGPAFDRLPTSMYTTVIQNPGVPVEWISGAIYYDHAHKDKKYEDYHPTPLKYYEYLKKLGIPMSEDLHRYSQTATEKLQQCENITEIEAVFPMCREQLRTII